MAISLGEIRGCREYGRMWERFLSRLGGFALSPRSRSDVAEELNSFLEAAGSSGRLAEDDSRLTDVICARYAYWLDEDDEEDRTLEIQSILEDLGLMGNPIEV
jgi:hypothetical protein